MNRKIRKYWNDSVLEHHRERLCYRLFALVIYLKQTPGGSGGTTSDSGCPRHAMLTLERLLFVTDLSYRRGQINLHRMFMLARSFSRALLSLCLPITSRMAILPFAGRALSGQSTFYPESYPADGHRAAVF